MKRIKMEVIFHVADSENEGVVADRLVAHMNVLRLDGKSRNDNIHYESCEVSVERKTWVDVS